MAAASFYFGLSAVISPFEQATLTVTLLIFMSPYVNVFFFFLLACANFVYNVQKRHYIKVFDI